jgi:hypothetical protein
MRLLMISLQIFYDKVLGVCFVPLHKLR